MASVYNTAFYQQQVDGSVRSARVVVPLVIDLCNPRSVIDVGCGVGGWVKVFADNGVSDYLGVDGDYVNKSMLLIPKERFHAADMRRPLNLGRRFDVACCLEVAEHIPQNFAAKLVEELTRLADIVVFSAAIPGQGGTDHINEQWQSYWAEIFATHDYVATDCIRPKIYGNPDVEWWYQQNILVFSAPGHPMTSHAPVHEPFWLDRIHPLALQMARDAPHSASEAVTIMRRSAGVIVRRVASRLLTRSAHDRPV